tara:strand:- start:209 stop:2791 length:2583 start_codon:yes stop_codon:yes gene_type:complete
MPIDDLINGNGNGNTGVVEKYGEKDAAAKLEWIGQLQEARDKVLGCTDPNATNYNPAANEDDGSCIYPPPADSGDVNGGNGNGGNGHPSISAVLDMKANPLPSLPSISTVGAASFTGVVNWNAIPGGFQPLPQVAGGSKKLYQLSQFHGGINLKSSPRDISDQECQQAINITFSHVGRIKLLGDLKSKTYTGLSVPALLDNANPTPGYGWFIFKAPYNLEDPRIAGDHIMQVTQDGYKTSVEAHGEATETILQIADAHTHVSPVYYAAGGGLYVCDANFEHTTDRQCLMSTYRQDLNREETLSGWSVGYALIDSPNDGSGSAEVGLEASGDDEISEETTARSMTIMTFHDGVAGSWNGTYNFYVSWLFDNGCETGLSWLGTDAPANEGLELNISFMHTAQDPLGGDIRIEGARIYFKKVGDRERFLLAELSLIDGIRGALDSTFTPIEETATNRWGLKENGDDNLIFDAPPEVYTYASLNGYYANEVYTQSPDVGAYPPSRLTLRYKTAVVGQNGIVFIGNVEFNKKVISDGMMFSMPGKPGVFPRYNLFDSPSSDGSPITALASFRDTILQFKENAMYVINVSNPAQFYAQASFRNCGVSNPCQVFTAPFGVIFANRNGCFIYDGQKVISLTNGKFNIGDWGITEAIAIGDDTASLPSVGYDPRSQTIIVLKNIGHDTTADAQDAWAYNMVTQSWSTSSNFIDNADGDTISNFIVSPNGYLSMIQYDATDPGEEPWVFALGQSDSGQTITYITKDIDFGFPSQTKKIFKIYVTYLGDGSAITVTYGADGDVTPTQAMTNAENSGATLTSAGTTDHNIATFTLNSHPSDLNSIALKFTGAAAADFEINDISILYRLRPIK